MPRKIRSDLETWIYIKRAFVNAGFTEDEAEYAADNSIFPRRELGKTVIEHRRASIEIYRELGYTRNEAIVKASEDLQRHNEKKGNEPNFIISEKNVEIG